MKTLIQAAPDISMTGYRLGKVVAELVGKQFKDPYFYGLKDSGVIASTFSPDGKIHLLPGGPKGFLAWITRYLAKQPDAQRMESAIHVAQLAAESAAAKALSGYNATAAPAFVVNLRKVDLDIAPLDLVSAITKILEEQGQ